MLEVMTSPSTNHSPAPDWRAIPTDLGPTFAARAQEHDATDAFVADNYADLKVYRAFSAGVPLELGGGGATHAELCGLVRDLGRSDGATALALSMHTHLVGSVVWRRRQGHPVDGLLKRI